ncbi:FAD-binding domain-containing protein [Umbelopsis sp. AD052]|nr:FAD-binding domain-containing protein [Umbelopsis sp. AD052]
MDMSNMSMDSTPDNVNTPYGAAFCGVLAGFIALLTLRRTTLAAIRSFNKRSYYRKLGKEEQITNKPNNSIYHKLENLIINKFSWTPYLGSYTLLPPLGGILIACALVSTIVPLLLLNVDLKLNSDRAGFISLAMIPFIFATTGKSSALVLLTGISHVQLNYMHRLLGTAIMATTTVHMSYMLTAWWPFPSFYRSQVATPKVHYGLVAYSSLCFIFFFSLYPIRRYCYGLFVSTHFLFLVFIIAAGHHTPYGMRYIATGIILYIINVLAGWFVNTYLTRARVHILEGECTRLVINSDMKHEAGQHVYICIPKISPFEWHPFTITSASKDTDCVELHAKVAGNYTRHLNSFQDGDEITLFVAGPYGSGSSNLGSHESSVIIAGGSGITFAIRHLKELADLSLEPSMSTTQSVTFAWCVRQPEHLSWFEDDIADCLQSFKESGVSVSIDLYISRPDPDQTCQSKLAYDNRVQYHVGQRVIPRQLIRDAAHNESAGIGIYVCGPSSLNSCAANAVACFSSLNKANIDFRREAFEY